jgi:hypothetical protein
VGFIIRSFVCALKASTVLRAVAADFFHNCWHMEIPSDNRIVKLYCKIFPACNHFLTEQFCIITSVLLSCLQSLSKQLSHIFLSRQVSRQFHTLGSLWRKVKTEKFCYLLLHSYQIFAMLPNEYFNVAEIQCRWSFVLQIELQSARDVTWDCAFLVLQEYRTKATFS